MGNLNLGFSAVAAGTADVITATYSPAITLSDRRIVFLTGCSVNLTTTPTFNPNALGAQVIKGKGGVALKAGEIKGDCILIYHTTGTYWELLASHLTKSNLEQILLNGQSTGDNAITSADGSGLLLLSTALSKSSLIWDDGSDYSEVKVDAAGVELTGTAVTKNGAAIATETYVASYAQPLDSDLTTIAGLSPSNDDIIQRKAGSWINRTMAQLWADLKSFADALYIPVTTKFGYEFNFNSGSVALSPARNTTYFFGSIEVNALSTTADLKRLYFTKPGTIKAITIFINNGGVLGTSEASTMNFRLNNTTDTVISNAVTTSAVTQVFSNTGLSIAVDALNYGEIKWPTPNWVTQPTLINISWSVLIETN